MSIPISEPKDRIREALEIRNIRQIELSKKSGISKGLINNYLSGYAKPKRENLILLGKALNVSEAWLMGYDVPMERQGVPNVENVDAHVELIRLYDLMDEKQREKLLDYALLLLK